MELIECNPPTDFCVVGLEHGVAAMRSAGVDVEDMRIMVSQSCGFRDIFEVVETVGVLFGFRLYQHTDSSDVMPLDAWMIMDTKHRALFYSPGT